MKIAVITITYNDDIRLKQWRNLYEEYRKDIYCHIIVDNGSSKEYLAKVKEVFFGSIIIERTSNGGCTGAYNDGINYSLNNTDCDSIALIANDTKVCKNYYPVLHKYLFSDEKLGMVSPTTLIKDSNIVNNSGHTLSKNLLMIGDYHGKMLDEVPVQHYTQMLLGGNNLAKRVFYEKVGLQDDKLFMFSDEIDTALRADKAGYKLGITSQVTSMHYHIPYNNELERPLISHYLIYRNKIYLANKHFGFKKKNIVFIGLFCNVLKNAMLGIIQLNFKSFAIARISLFGLYYGYLGNMNENRYFKK